MVQHYLHCCSYLVLTPAASLKAPQHIEKLIPQAFACVPSRNTSGRQCTTALQFLGSLSKQSRVCGFVLPPQPFQPHCHNIFQHLCSHYSYSYHSPAFPRLTWLLLLQHETIANCQAK